MLTATCTFVFVMVIKSLISLSQFCSNMLVVSIYHVLHSFLPDDKHNVANHFRLQCKPFSQNKVFQILPAAAVLFLCCYVILLFFINVPTQAVDVVHAATLSLVYQQVFFKTLSTVPSRVMTTVCLV